METITRNKRTLILDDTVTADYHRELAERFSLNDATPLNWADRYEARVENGFLIIAQLKGVRARHDRGTFIYGDGIWAEYGSPFSDELLAR